jgi:hypothetical protein
LNERFTVNSLHIKKVWIGPFDDTGYCRDGHEKPTPGYARVCCRMPIN